MMMILIMEDVEVLEKLQENQEDQLDLKRRRVFIILFDYFGIFCDVFICYT